MSKCAVLLAGLTLIITIVGINPQPLQDYLLTLAFTFPKTLFLNLSALLGVLIVVRVFGRELLAERSENSNRLRNVDLVFCVFSLVSIISSFAYPIPLNFRFQWLTLVAPMVGLAWLSSLGCRDADGTKRLYGWILVAATLIVSLAFYDSLGLPLPWLLKKRPTGILGNRSDVAAFCVVTLPLAIWSFLQEINKKRSRLIEFSRFCLMAALMGMVIICRSRAGWVGLAAMFVFAGLMGLLRFLKYPASRIDNTGSKNKIRAFFVVAMAILLGIIAATQIEWPGLRWREPEPYKSTLSRIFEADRGTGLGRVQQNQVALEMLAERPLLGFGPGAWRREVGRFITTVPGVPEDFVGHTQVPNSEYITLVTETGLLGVGCVLLMSWLLLSPTIRSFLRRESPDTFPLVCGLVGLGAMSALDSMSVRHEILVYLSISVGILRADSSSFKYESSILNLKRYTALLRPVMIFILLISFGYSALSTYGSYVLLTNRNPGVLSGLPDYIPMPPYAMIAIKNIPILGPNPCEQSRRAFIRLIEEYPYETKLMTTYDQVCDSDPQGLVLGQENATWARSIFFRGFTPTKGEILTENDIEDFAKTLLDANIKYAYLFSGPFQLDGSLPDFAYSERARESIKKIKAAYPKIKILPWIGGIQNKNIKLNDRKWMDQALVATKRILEEMPVDGVHLDFEFIMPGDQYLHPETESADLKMMLAAYDEGLLEFHRRIRELKPQAFISSVVVSSAENTRPWKKKHTLQQIEELSQNVNQLSFLYYDTRINDRSRYEAGMYEQLQHIQILKDKLGTRAPQYLIAIGTFINEPELRVYRDMTLENIPDTLSLMKGLIARLSHGRQLVDGLAIYCEWLTTSDEWNEIKALWTRPLTTK